MGCSAVPHFGVAGRPDLITSKQSLMVINDHLAGRLRARISAVSLDRELADGVPIDSCPLLRLRADALTDPCTAFELGTYLRRIVREAHERPRPIAHIPPARDHVLGAEDDLRLLASRLQSPTPLAARGVAKARLLLTDATGPMFNSCNPADLGAEVRDAISALR
jgi:hypothetical protein